ncbi:OmpA family protein [Tenacibaculum salmonis]|uniref:OmpA family protein n=1 Tax=Tenacibaculum sp. P3-BQ1 TaxID=3232310 RepID=UPI0034DE5513
MATYKKRGYKPKKEKIVEEVEETFDESQSTTAEVFNTLDDTANKSEEWIEKNSKPLFLGLVTVAAVILGYLAYTNFISKPNEQEASNELAYPRTFFDKATTSAGTAADALYNTALNGGDGKYGFTDIANEFNGTKAGNLANYYAGISFLKTKKYEQAIEYLSNFNSEDELLGPTALGAIGDAFADINQPEDALTYYEKAANKRNNNFTTPLFLFKAAQTAMTLKEYNTAEKLYTKIKEKYPTTDQGKDIQKYINTAKYADASSAVSLTKVEKTNEIATSTKEVKVINDVNALYNTTSEFLGKSVKGYEYLGEFVNLKLENGSELIALSKGFESGLLNFIKSDAKADKNTWFNLRRVLFKTGSADLDEKSNNQIDNIVTILKAYPNVNLKLGGYTDNTGNANSNKKLSERRANAVLNSIVSKGIAKERLKAEGYGIEHSIADNNTSEGRALNRRVAARVSKK